MELALNILDSEHAKFFKTVYPEISSWDSDDYDHIFPIKGPVCGTDNLCYSKSATSTSPQPLDKQRGQISF